MKWIYRSWLSIIRRPKKILTLFLVAFSMTTLLAGSLGIVMTCNHIQEEIKIGVGSTALVSGNFSKNQQIYPYIEKKDLIHEYINIMEQLTKNECVATSEYHFTGEGQANFGVDFLKFDFYSTNIEKSNEFKEGNHILTRNGQARYFTSEEIENGDHVIIVDERLSMIPQDPPLEPIPSGLTDLGNVVTLSVPIYVIEDDEIVTHFYDYEFEVIGTFKSKDKKENPIIYLPNKALIEIVEDAVKQAENNGLNGNISLNSDYAGFVIKELDMLEPFDQNAKAMISKISTNFEYSSSSDTYRRNAGPVENLNTVAKVIFIGSVLATILILGLVIASSIMERKKEIGIYESIGEKTKNIILQFLCEVLLVSTLSIACSSLSGIALGNALSDYMLDIQKYVQREQVNGVINELPVLYKPIKNGITATRNEIIEGYELEINAQYFVTIFIVGELSVCISCVLPLIYLTKLKTKEVML